VLLIDTFNRADPVSGNHAGATWARPQQNAGLPVSATQHEISGLPVNVCPGAATAAHVHEDRPAGVGRPARDLRPAGEPPAGGECLSGRGDSCACS